MGPEAKIQASVVKYARSAYKGQLIARKIESGKFGSAGWPDYEFNVLGGHTFFIEFKAPGGQLTDLQAARHRALKALGFRVHTTNDAQAGRDIVDHEVCLLVSPCPPR